jgi:hypothetical protein
MGGFPDRLWDIAGTMVWIGVVERSIADACSAMANKFVFTLVSQENPA